MEQQSPEAQSTAGITIHLIYFFLDLIKQYSDIIYKTSAKEVGKTAHLAQKGEDFGHNGKFSKVTTHPYPFGVVFAKRGQLQEQRAEHGAGPRAVHGLLQGLDGQEQLRMLL